MESPGLERVQKAAERYITGVVEPRIRYYQSQGDKSRRRFNGSRVLIIVFSLVLPALAAVNPGSVLHAPASVLVTGLPICIALLAALDGFYRFGEVWHSRISTALALRRFKRQFEADLVEVNLMPANEQPSGALKAYRRLVRFVEDAMAGEERAFWEKRIRDLTAKDRGGEGSTKGTPGPAAGKG